MMRFTALLFVALLAGCSGPTDPMTPLLNATSLELYSLDPMENSKFDPNTGFHGWKVLGTTEVNDVPTREKLINALAAGIAENDGEIAACFEPRHGIRVIVDGRQYDYVICFHCYSARWYTEGAPNQGFLTTGAPQPEFDRILTDASIDLAPAAPD